MSDLPEGALLLSSITITRYLAADGQDIVLMDFEDPDGQRLPLVESLGLLELARDTVLHPDDEEDEDDQED